LLARYPFRRDPTGPLTGHHAGHHLRVDHRAAGGDAAHGVQTADGWRLVEATVAANLWKTAKAEFVMILERELR